MKCNRLYREGQNFEEMSGVNTQELEKQQVSKATSKSTDAQNTRMLEMANEQVYIPSGSKNQFLHKIRVVTHMLS